MTQSTVISRAPVQNELGFYSLPSAHHDHPALRAVKSGQIYRPALLHFLCSHLGRGDAIIANTRFGDFLPALSKSLASDAHIWGFEPDPDFRQAAQLTLELNNAHNVTLTQAQASHYAGQQGADARHVVLDNALPVDRAIRVIHLDLEGSELAALEGARHIVTRWHPILAINGLYDVDQINDICDTSVYTHIGRLDQSAIFAPRQDGVSL